MVSAGTLGIVMQENTGFDFGVRVGNVIAVIISIGLSFLILKEKKLLGNFGFILIALLAGLITLLIGGLGGFILVAYLTTRPANAPSREISF